MNYRYLLIILLISCFGCELEKDIDISLPQGEKHLILEAYLVQNQSYKLLLYQSNTLHEPVVYDFVWNASIQIFNETDTIRLSNMIEFDNESGYLYNYISGDTVKNDADTYTLRLITRTHDTITAITKPVPEISIDTAYATNNSLVITAANSSRSDFNYYLTRGKIYRNDSIENFQYVYDFSSLPEGPVNFETPVDMHMIDSIQLNAYRFDKAAYDYHISIEKAYSANQDPFTIPTEICGNTSNGYGIFTCCSTDNFSIKID